MATTTSDMREHAESTLASLADRLVLVSEIPGASPFARVTFPDQLDRRHPVMPPELTTLAGLPAYERLDEGVRWRLGLLEAVNFFSVNIHGEQALVGELAERLYRARWSGEGYAVSRYLQHFIHEENSHTYMLAEFCTRYYGRVMPEIVYRFERPVLSRSGRDLLFFGRVYVLEMFLHFVNRVAIRCEELDPTARAIHSAHDSDESRHIAFDRAVLAALVAEMRDKSLESEMVVVARLLDGYGDYAFSRLVNPRIYRELQLEDPLTLARQAESAPRWVEIKARCREIRIRQLEKIGLAG